MEANNQITNLKFEISSRFLWFALALLLSAAYMFAWTNAGWLPQDDGVLAQSALRVLHGQLPHRDFVENYTGGLSYWNAAGFRLFGVSLISPRIGMFLCFLLWVPAIFYITSRMASPMVAAGVTLAAVAWSVPNYPTPMPSWYNLFFAVLGAAALFRYMEGPARGWLLAAGFSGGLSFDAKITGLYYLAAVLLFMVYREQELNGKDSTSAHFPSAYGTFVIGALVAFLGALTFLLRHRLDTANIIHFLLPSLALVAVLVIRELYMAESPSARRFRSLFRMIWPFALGFLIPVIALLTPYALSASLGALLRGVFMGGMERALAVAAAPPAPAHLLFLPACALFLIGMAVCWKRASGWVPALLVASASAGCLLFVTHPGSLLRLWHSVSLMTPLVVILGAGILLARPVFADALSPARRQQLMLMLALAAVCSIVQFPFAAPIYFCYCAPLVGLTLAALATIRRQPANRPVVAIILCFYILFAAVRITPRHIYRNFDLSPDSPPLQSFHLPRAAGLQGAYAGNYEAAAKIVQEHSPNGLLVASPECPELYFLSGLQNPTGNDLGLSSEELLKVVEQPDLKVVAINLQPIFAQNALSLPAAQRLTQLFPHAQRVGKFWIGWRE
jgi:hypothetical protein